MKERKYHHHSIELNDLTKIFSLFFLSFHFIIYPQQYNTTNYIIKLHKYTIHR